MASKKRLKLNIQSRWSKEIEKWTINQIRQNKWRFDQIDEIEDVLQEARMVFLKLERYYPTILDIEHFFTLYKTSLKRYFIDKARKRRHVPEFASLENFTENALPESNLQNLGPLSIILEELPSELKTVLNSLTLGRVRLKLNRPKKYHLRENLNMRLKRLHGVDLDTLKNHLT